jgi:hypothetical protein
MDVASGKSISDQALERYHLAIEWSKRAIQLVAQNQYTLFILSIFYGI